MAPKIFLKIGNTNYLWSTGHLCTWHPEQRNVAFSFPRHGEVHSHDSLPNNPSDGLWWNQRATPFWRTWILKIRFENNTNYQHQTQTPFWRTWIGKSSFRNTHDGRMKKKHKQVNKSKYQTTDVSRKARRGLLWVSGGSSGLKQQAGIAAQGRNASKSERYLSECAKSATQSCAGFKGCCRSLSWALQAWAPHGWCMAF